MFVLVGAGAKIIAKKGALSKCVRNACALVCTLVYLFFDIIQKT